MVIIRFSACITTRDTSGTNPILGFNNSFPRKPIILMKQQIFLFSFNYITVEFIQCNCSKLQILSRVKPFIKSWFFCEVNSGRSISFKERYKGDTIREPSKN